MTQQPDSQSTRTRERALRVRQAQPAMAHPGAKVRQGDVLAEAWCGEHLKEVCMRREKTIGKPCAGNPHARFERGPQETGPRTGYRA